ncbi:MAG: hypothetical protein RIG26_14910 [Thalassospira sp.]|uniref:hypothetical protein n=1 Tax=Thalassospira sp. TaxID=1912094 RepID=UPI0032EF726B
MSISGSGGWASEASRGGNYGGGPNRSNERSGGDNGGNTLSRSQFNSFFGGGGGSSPSGGGSRGGGNNQPQAAPAPTGNMAMRSSLAELQRRDRAAVAALGGTFGGVNQASMAFNDDEEGINSIDEALDSFGAWAKDQVGINNPRGFLGSNAAKVGAGALGFLAGGAPGAALASTAVSVASDPKPSRNMVGYAASALGGLPGLGGLAANAVSLFDDNVVDLDKVVATSPTSTNTLGSYRAPEGNTTTLGNQFPGGRQGDNDKVAPPKPIKRSSVGEKSGRSSSGAKPKTSQRRTLSPLNLRFAALRGVPTIEELL